MPALTITGNTNDALAAVAKLERQVDSLENKLKRMGAEAKGASSGWDSSLDGVIGKYASIATVVGGVGMAIRGTMAENEKFLRQLDELAAKNPETMLKLQIQGAMTSPEVRAMLPGIERSLVATPTANLDQALKIQTQLSSSGFRGEDVKSGAALEAMLKIKAATNQFGESIGDESEAAKSMSMLLKAGGSANPSAKEMTELGGSIVSLFEKSDVQFPDFKQLAPKIAGLKNFGLSMEESVATFSALTDVMGGNKADTGLAQFVSRTATAGAFKERAEQLEAIGLKPSDVAMAPGGKGLIETVDLLRGKLKGLPEDQQNNFIAKLYGEEAGPSASYLLSNSGSAKMKEYIETANNRDPFQRNVNEFQNSRYAKNARTKVIGEFSVLRHDMNTGRKTWSESDAEQASNLDLKNEGKGWFARNANNFGHAVEYSTTIVPRWAGMTPSEVGVGDDSIYNENIRLSEQKREETLIREGQAAKAGINSNLGNEKTVAELRRIADLTQQQLDELRKDKQRPVNRNGNIERD